MEALSIYTSTSYLLTQFREPAYNDALIISIRPKAVIFVPPHCFFTLNKKELVTWWTIQRFTNMQNPRILHLWLQCCSHFAGPKDHHVGTIQQIPWPIVSKRTIPTERSPLVDEIWCQILWIEGCRVVSAADHLRSFISVI
jgi:hypothetical protein